MAKKEEKGKQLDLIDVAPENAKPIIEAARKYKHFQTERLGFLKKEIEQKVLILELIHKAGLQKLKGGKIKFEYDGVILTVTPRDELVQVKEKKDEAKPDEE